jgi:MFS family permease
VRCSIGRRLTAPLLLALTFVNGIGMAMRWPVFAAIVPEVVPRGTSCRRRWRSTAWR